MPQAVVETGDGPPEADLPKVLDLALYPGSKVVKNKAAHAGQEKRYHVTITTHDDLAKVADFYKTQGLSGTVQSGKYQANGVTKNGNMVLIDGHAGESGNEIEIKVIVASK